jgi:hypothetical protein
MNEVSHESNTAEQLENLPLEPSKINNELRSGAFVEIVGTYAVE